MYIYIYICVLCCYDFVMIFLRFAMIWYDLLWFRNDFAMILIWFCYDFAMILCCLLCCPDSVFRLCDSVFPTLCSDQQGRAALLQAPPMLHSETQSRKHRVGAIGGNTIGNTMGNSDRQYNRQYIRQYNMQYNRQYNRQFNRQYDRQIKKLVNSWKIIWQNK